MIGKLLILLAIVSANLDCKVASLPLESSENLLSLDVIPNSNNIIGAGHFSLEDNDFISASKSSSAEEKSGNEFDPETVVEVIEKLKSALNAAQIEAQGATKIISNPRRVNKPSKNSKNNRNDNSQSKKSSNTDKNQSSKSSNTSNDKNQKSSNSSNNKSQKSSNGSNDKNQNSSNSSNDKNQKSSNSSNDKNQNSSNSSNDKNQKSTNSSNDKNQKSSNSSNDKSQKSSNSSNDKNQKSSNSSNDKNQNSSNSSNDKNQNSSNSGNDKNQNSSNSSNNKNQKSSNSGNDKNQKSSNSSNDKNQKSSTSSNDKKQKSSNSSNDTNKKSSHSSNDKNQNSSNSSNNNNKKSSNSSNDKNQKSSNSSNENNKKSSNSSNDKNQNSSNSSNDKNLKSSNSSNDNNKKSSNSSNDKNQKSSNSSNDKSQKSSNKGSSSKGKDKEKTKNNLPGEPKSSNKSSALDLLNHKGFIKDLVNYTMKVMADRDFDLLVNTDLFLTIFKEDYEALAEVAEDNDNWEKYIKSAIENFYLEFNKIYFNLVHVQSDNGSEIDLYNKAYDLAMFLFATRKNFNAVRMAAPVRRIADVIKSFIGGPIEMVQTSCKKDMPIWQCNVAYLSKLIAAADSCPHIWFHSLVLETMLEYNRGQTLSIADPITKALGHLKSKGGKSPLKDSTQAHEVFDFILKILLDTKDSARSSLQLRAKLYQFIIDLQNDGNLDCTNIGTPLYVF